MNVKNVLLVISLLIPIISLFTLPCETVQAAVQEVNAGGWSDDFNDGNYDGWTITGINSTGETVSSLPGNFSAADKTLRATGPEWNHASHPSSVVAGTWLFDVDAVDTPDHHFYVMFSSASANLTENPPDSYELMIVTGAFTWGPSSEGPAFVLFKVESGTIYHLGHHKMQNGISREQHVNVTRDTSGRFSVSVNSTIIIEAVDTAFTSSEFFRFHAEEGPALDNITVSSFNGIETGVSSTTTEGTDTKSTSGFASCLLLLMGCSLVIKRKISYRARHFTR